MSIVVHPAHTRRCRKQTQTLWQRIWDIPWHPLILIERYQLLCGSEAIQLTCAHCAAVALYRKPAEGGPPVRLEGIDVYGIPTELSTVIAS